MGLGISSAQLEHSKYRKEGEEEEEEDGTFV